MNEGVVSERLGLPGQPIAESHGDRTEHRALRSDRRPPAHRPCDHSARAGTGRGRERPRAAGDLRGDAEPPLPDRGQPCSGPAPNRLRHECAKINPPLRTEADRLALLRGVNEGSSMPSRPTTRRTPSRTNSASSTRRRRASAASRRLCHAAHARGARRTGPATAMIRALTQLGRRAFGIERLFPRAGRLAEGVSGYRGCSTPDRWTVDAKRFVSKGKNTPLNGMSSPARVRAVVLGGCSYEREAANV
jgi:dihydroorotase